MSTEDPKPKQEQSLRPWSGDRIGLSVCTIPLALVFAYYLVDSLSGGLQGSTPVNLTRAAFFAGGLLLMGSVPLFLETKDGAPLPIRNGRIGAFVMALGALLCGVSAVVYLALDSEPTIAGQVIEGIAALFFLAFPAIVWRTLLEPDRRKERERRQKLLAAIEALAEKNPDLYVVAQLVRDDINISSRQSNRQSWMQNGFFFVAGLAIPYVIQFGVPAILTLLNLK